MIGWLAAAFASALQPAVVKEPFSERVEALVHFATREGPTGMLGLSMAVFPVPSIGIEAGVGTPSRQHLAARFRARANRVTAFTFGIGVSHGELERSDAGCVSSPLLLVPGNCDWRSRRLWKDAWQPTADVAFEIISGAHVVTRLGMGATYLLNPNDGFCESICVNSTKPCPDPACPSVARWGAYAELSVGIAF